MIKQKVYIGRVWPVWPTHVRVTVGTKDEMAKFKVAFKTVMDAPATATLAIAEYANRIPFWHLG